MKSFERCFPLTSGNKPQSSLVLYASLKSVVTAYIISVVGFQSYLHFFCSKNEFLRWYLQRFQTYKKIASDSTIFHFGGRKS